MNHNMQLCGDVNWTNVTRPQFTQMMLQMVIPVHITSHPPPLLTHCWSEPWMTSYLSSLSENLHCTVNLQLTLLKNLYEIQATCWCTTFLHKTQHEYSNSIYRPIWVCSDISKSSNKLTFKSQRYFLGAVIVWLNYTATAACFHPPLSLKPQGVEAPSRRQVRNYPALCFALTTNLLLLYPHS